MKNSEKGVHIKDRRFMFIVYPNCFVGKLGKCVGKVMEIRV
jgi:hypothetical protein